MSGNDYESVKLCLNGHPDHFRTLIGRYQSTLLSFLSGRLKNRAMAEEAVQETFVRAYFSLKQLKKPESFFPWLVGIADRVSKEELRTQKREHRLKEDIPSPEAHAPDLPLQEAVSLLPEPLREVVLLRFYNGLTCEETAQRLGAPINTITKRLSRAYKMLRTSLQTEFEVTS